VSHHHVSSCRPIDSLSLLVPSECYITAFEESAGTSPVPTVALTIDVLLPNGLVACIKRTAQQTLADLRKILRQDYGVSGPFHFLSITHTFTNDQGDFLLDEQQTVDSLGLVYPFVRVSNRGEGPAPLCQWLSTVDQQDIESLTQYVEQLAEWRDATMLQEVLHAPPAIAFSVLSNIDLFLVHVERLDKSYSCSPEMTCETLLEKVLHDDGKNQLEYYNASTRPMLKFAYRNEFLHTPEPYPLLQYTYVQECLQKNLPIHLQLHYIPLPKKSKKVASTHVLTEPNIFRSTRSTLSILLNHHENETQSQPSLIAHLPVASLFTFNFRLPPSADAKETLYQLHSAVYYGRRCLFLFDPINWNNTCVETITQSTSLLLASLLPGTVMCFALTSKQAENYFLNISLFRSNGTLLNGCHEFHFNLVKSSTDMPNNKHLFPDSFVGSSTNDWHTAPKYKIHLKFDLPSARFYFNEEVADQLKKIVIPMPTAVSTAKHQQNQESSDDVANGEALNYLLGILSDEVRQFIRCQSSFSSLLL
jgi:hypothetical protein